MQETVMTITPALAAEWLKKNSINRKLRPYVVSGYANDMRAGRWHVTHQGIAFDDDGTLVDGQHRLHAIIQSGASIAMRVVYGVSKDAFAYIDGGLPRTASDKLKVDSSVAEVAKFALLAFKGKKRPDIEELRSACENVTEDVQRLTEFCSTSRRGVSAVPVRTAAIVLMREQPERAESILKMYKAIVLRHYEDMSKAAQSFVRQVDSGRVSMSSEQGRFDTFARAMAALDPERNDRGVRVCDTEVSCRRADTVLFQ